MSLVQLCPNVAVDPSHVVAVSYLHDTVEVRLDTNEKVVIYVHPGPTQEEQDNIVPAILSKLNQKGN